ncbi:MAG: hypothetical protein JRJ87_18350 [Deltaproteobacteria bacterium]|nr:hypothetical protein [Deltaproteobacteria bacterium]
MITFFMLPAEVIAVDGVSVTAHWSGSNENLYGGYGQIVRHDIVNNVVTDHTVLYPLNAEQPGRNPVINFDGTHVAFLRQDGRILVVPIAGGDPTVLQSAQSHGEACLDWPQGDWIYYNKGGFSQPSGSKLLHRVNAFTDQDEFVLTFKKEDGTTDSGTWRFHIAADNQKAAIRPDDTNPHPAGCITAFDLVNDTHLRTDRSLGAVGDYRCSTGIDPLGVYFSEGNVQHSGVTVHLWSDLSEVKTFLWEDARLWGPDTSDTGISHNRNAWSTNSQKWMCIHVGWGNRGFRGANQMLINWDDQERIVASTNTDNSYEFDDAGDFWVDSGPRPAEISGHPQDLTVSESETAQFAVTATGTAPLSYQWQRNSSDIGGANSASYSFDAFAQDDGASFRCVVSNSFGSDTSDPAILTVLSDTTPPTIASVTSVGDPNSVSVEFSEAIEQISAEAESNYAIDNGISTTAASLGADLRTVTLTTSSLSSGITYTLTVNNVKDRALTPNSIAADSTATFQYESGSVNIAPSVDAGADNSVQVNIDILLNGTVTDDGLPSGNLTINWSKISGPGGITFVNPDQASTFARFDTVGDYVLRLLADDGDKSSSDEVGITVTGPPSIAIVSPAGGELWQTGSVQTIQWTAFGVFDVRIDYSVDGGQNWNQVEASIDTNSPNWQNYPWTVPNDPSEQAIIQLTEYSLITSAQSNLFSIVGSGQTIDLQNPSAGDSLTGEETVQIVWTAEELQTVVLELTLDSGETWEPIATIATNDAEWGSYPWTVPNVFSHFAEVRARSASGQLEDSSGLFNILPATLAASGLELSQISISIRLPETAGNISTVKVAGSTVEVDPDRTFRAIVDVPACVDSLVFEVSGDDGTNEYHRLVRADILETAPPIEGLGVSKAELVDFLGGRSGVLIWVDAGSRTRVLDFREDNPVVIQLSQELDCVNPLISPDGTRIVYSQGLANGPKQIFVTSLSGGTPQLIAATCDVGYWHVNASQEFIVYSDWSSKSENGADGNTYRRKLLTGGITPDGEPEQIHDRAMDAGPNSNLVWLGQVYGNLWAYNLVTGQDYPTAKFFLLDDSPADHQTCNGSMAADTSGKLMCLVIPHDYVRVFTHQTNNDSFKESSRFNLPVGMVEWEFPEWSTDPGYFTAILRASNLENRLFVIKMAEGELIPQMLEISGEETGASYSHLYLEP